MKSFLLACLVLVLLIGGFCIYHVALTDIVEELCALAELGQIPELSQAFLEAKPFFGIFLNHTEVGMLEDSIARLQVLYHSDHQTDCKAEQNLFVSRLRALYENERLGSVNIL